MATKINDQTRPIFPSFMGLEATGFDNYHKIVIRTCAKILAYVTYAGKYQNACIRHHTSFLVVSPTAFRKFVLIYIANSAKADIEVSLGKIHTVTLRTYFKNYAVQRECKGFFYSLLMSS